MTRALITAGAAGIGLAKPAAMELGCLVTAQDVADMAIPLASAPRVSG